MTQMNEILRQIAQKQRNGAEIRMAQDIHFGVRHNTAQQIMESKNKEQPLYLGLGHDDGSLMEAASISDAEAALQHIVAENQALYTEILRLLQQKELLLQTHKIDKRTAGK